jgi:HEAT repeat protein/lysophospholipase L1-like esterase
MEEGRPRQSLPVNLLLSLLSIAGFLAVAEGLARRYEPPPRPRLPENYTFDWEADWGDDFYVLRFPSTGWPRSEAFNRDGVRDRAHPVEKLEGVRRVVCLGDSVTLGYPGPPEGAYPRVLESLIEARGPGVEVFNVALMAWSTRQERIAYERIARKYRPDQVILGICLNDPQELQNNLSRPSPWVAGLFRRSALARWVVNAEGREIDSVQRLFLAPDSFSVRAGMGRFYQELRQLRDVVRQDGVDFSAVLFPYSGQVVPDAHPPTVQDEIKAFCAREGIPVLDVLPTLRTLGPRGFTRDDHIHPTGEGYARVADAMLEAGLVPEASYSIKALEEALAGRPPDPTVLVSLLDSPRAEVRYQAVWRLGRDGAAASPAVPALTRRLKDAHARVQAAAAGALERIGPLARAAVPDLLDQLGNPHQAVRWKAADAVSSIGLTPAELPRLADALAHRDEYVRAFAAFSLGEMVEEGRPAASALAAAVSDPDPSVRAVVVTALAKIGASEPPVIEALERALADRTWEYRWRAARALGRIHTDAGGTVASLAAALAGDDDVKVRREAARALGRFGRGAEPAIRELSAARRDPDPDVRQTAAWALEAAMGGGTTQPPALDTVEAGSGALVR